MSKLKVGDLVRHVSQNKKIGPWFGVVEEIGGGTKNSCAKISWFESKHSEYLPTWLWEKHYGTMWFKVDNIDNETED